MARAYAPTEIPSVSGEHDIQAGGLLPDSLTGFLTATPFSYTNVAASAFTATGEHFDEANVRRAELAGQPDRVDGTEAIRRTNDHS